MLVEVYIILVVVGEVLIQMTNVVFVMVITHLVRMRVELQMEDVVHVIVDVILYLIVLQPLVINQLMNVVSVMEITLVVLIALVYQTEMQLQITVVPVMLMHQMTVRKIVMELGVVTLKTMNVVYVMVQV
jgi:hypothetical protein